MKARKVKAKRLIGMMTKIRAEITREVRADGTIIKSLTKTDQESLDEAYKISKKILLASGAKPETITRELTQIMYNIECDSSFNSPKSNNLVAK